MADSTSSETQQPPNTPTPPVSTQVQPLFRSAPLLPVPGAALASPMTGQGPAVFEEVAQANQSPKPVAPVHPPRPRGRVTPVTPPVATVTAAPAPPTTAPASPTAVNLLHMMPQSPAAETLITQVVNMQRTAGQKFYLLILPDDGWPSCEPFDDVKELVRRITELLGTPNCLFPFLGHLFSITEGPYRFLHTPMGALPLFTIPDPTRTDSTRFGWVGESLDRPEPPTTEIDETIPDDVSEEAETIGSETTDLGEATQGGTDTPIF